MKIVSLETGDHFVGLTSFDFLYIKLELEKNVKGGLFVYPSRSNKNPVLGKPSFHIKETS